jgi:hypothetical protein
MVSRERYNALMNDQSANLSDSEFRAGWHFCYDWDGLLIGPGMKEMECCNCKHAGQVLIQAIEQNQKIKKESHDATIPSAAD